MTVTSEQHGELATQVQWLVDRAGVSDALVEFAYALDTQNWELYASLYAPDGALELPFADADGTPAGHRGRAGLAEYVEAHLGRFEGTHHMSTNHRITVSGDRATTRSYLHCIHRLDSDPSHTWEVGGWYDCELARAGSAGWLFDRVRLHGVWENQPSPIGPEASA